VSDFTCQKTVSEIIKKVRQKRDVALSYYSKKFDGIALKQLKVPKKRLKKAFESLSAEEKKALEAAARNIEFFAKKQLPRSWQKKRNSVLLGEIVKPIDSVGVYVPAGRFPLVSSVLMNCIPARVAGVKQIVLCTPPKASSKVLAAAFLLGIKNVFLVGGAQAIAAMAFGTESVPRVCKIVGPGNAFVAEAKRQLFGVVDIDMPAGPSEVLVYANKGKPDWIAAELRAQAEHADDAKSVFLTTNKTLARKIKKLVQTQANISIVLAKSKVQAVAFINDFAPEHLVLFDGARLLPKIQNAGSIFVGAYSAVAFGDYCSGSNHVLPTAGFAKARAGLGARDFVKAVAFQKVSKNGAKALAKTGIALARMEGLKEHEKSIELRG